MKYVAELRAREGKEKAWAYVKQFGATKEDRENYLREKAKKEYEQDEV